MTQFAKTYGGALYELAREEGLESALLEQMETLAAAFAAQPQYIKLLNSPLLPKEERREIVQRDFGGAALPYLLNFLKMLCDKGEAGQFAGCTAQVRAQYNADHGIVEAVAVTAKALTDAQAAALREKLEQTTGKTVRLKNRVDESVLGGVRLEMEGKQLDGTIRSRLEAIRRRLDTATL